MATTNARPALINRVLTNSTGAPYASANIRIVDQTSRQPMRLYSDAAGLNMINSLGQTSTNAAGVVNVYCAKRNVEIQVLAANGTIAETFNDVTPGDPEDLGYQTLFLSAGRITTAQATVGANTDLILNDGTGNGIALNTTTGVITLKGGYTYELRAALGFSTFSNTTGGTLTVEWVGGDNVALVASRAAVITPTTSTVASNSNPMTAIFFTATADIQVKLRCTAATGTATLDIGNSTVTVISNR